MGVEPAPYKTPALRQGLRDTSKIGCLSLAEKTTAGGLSMSHIGTRLTEGDATYTPHSHNTEKEET